MVGTDRWAVHSLAAPAKIGRQFTIRSRGMLTEANEETKALIWKMSSLSLFFYRIPLWRGDCRRFLQKAELLAVNIPACHAKIEA
jgi:hypothetical protein